MAARAAKSVVNEGKVHALRRRSLAAIVHADIVGYSKLVAGNDADTMERIARLRTTLLEPLLERHRGRLLNTAGDAFLLTFASSADAVAFAVELQNRVPEFDEARAADALIRLRVGIEIGDVIAAEAASTGEGINIAARLQAICPPGGVCVSRNVYDHVHGRLKLAFEPRGPVALKNIGRPVDAFVLHYRPGGVGTALPPLRRRRWAWALGAVFLGAASAALALTLDAWRHVAGPPPAGSARADAPRPALSLAVLPFVNLSDDPGQGYLADGIAEDLTTDLSQVPGATVIARESAFSFRGRQVDVREIGHDLGVRYVVEGSIRKVGETLRVNAQLVSGETGAHLWARRSDHKLADMQNGVDGLAGDIAAALGVAPAAAAAIARRAPPTSAAAYDLVLRARSVMTEPRSDVRDAIARGLFEQALRIDPTCVPAMAGVASLLVRRSGPTRRAATLIADAEAVAPDSPDVVAAKFLLERAQGRLEESVATFRHLLATDPSAAGIAAQAGNCAACWGLPDDAIPLLERVALLDPRAPNSAVIDVDLGFQLLLAGRDQEAILWLQQALDRPRAQDEAASADSARLRNAAQTLLAAAQAQTGRTEEARQTLAKVLASPLSMDFSLDAYARGIAALPNPALRSMAQRILEGLRLAGLREHLDETEDSRLPNDATLRDVGQLDAPTPIAVPGGATLLTEQLVALIRDEHPLLLTTAAANPTIPGAIQMPITFGGSMEGAWQTTLGAMVQQLTGGDRHRPIVTFAASLNRWHARNLALRLIALGYDRVYWYRGGVEAWNAHHLPTAPVIPRAEFSR